MYWKLRNLSTRTLIDTSMNSSLFPKETYWKYSLALFSSRLIRILLGIKSTRALVPFFSVYSCMNFEKALGRRGFAFNVSLKVSYSLSFKRTFMKFFKADLGLVSIRRKLLKKSCSSL